MYCVNVLVMLNWPEYNMSVDKITTMNLLLGIKIGKIELLLKMHNQDSIGIQWAFIISHALVLLKVVGLLFEFKFSFVYVNLSVTQYIIKVWCC